MVHNPAPRCRRIRPTTILLSALLLSVVCSVPAATAETTQVGFASWYGSRFQGRLTASGEVFDMNKLTAAHRTLPFGTRVRVTNLANGKSTIVTINDRGPFVANRVIDLSRAAAMAIGMAGTGVAEVRLQVLTTKPSVASIASVAPEPSSGTPASAGVRTVRMPLPAVTEPVAKASPQPTGGKAAVSLLPAAGEAPPSGTSATGSTPSPSQPVIVQIGAFRDLRNAVRVADRLQSRGLRPIYERYGDLTRVVLPSVVPADIPALRVELSQLGYPSILIRRE